MEAKRVGTFYLVRDVLTTFMMMGCELNIAEKNVLTPDGDCWNVRYLLNPLHNTFVPVVDLSDDQFVSAGEVEDWERRLKLVIPKPTPRH